MAERQREQPDDHVSDRSLLRRLRTGNEDAATQLYRRYAQRLVARLLQEARQKLDGLVQAE